MTELKVKDTLVAVDYCGFPDMTTKGKEYKVTEVFTNKYDNQNFKIICDDGVERMPISTTFSKK